MRTNNPIYIYRNWFIIVYAIIIISGAIWTLDFVSIYYVLLICLGILYIFAYWISFIYVYENKVVIKFPFRVFARKIELPVYQLNVVTYCSKTSKANSEYIKFDSDGNETKVYIYSFSKFYPMLVFLQSKGVKVEIKGTEHNSIEDLR